MNLSKEIQYILRRIVSSDLKEILSQVMMDQMSCYYKAKYGEAGLGMYLLAVRNELSDLIFYRMANYNLLNDDEATEGDEINIINKGLEEMFTNTIKDYYRNQDCENYGVDNSEFINEAKYDKKDAANFLFRRISENDLEDEFYENYKYYSEGHSHPGNTYSSFKRRFLDYMMDGIHGFLVDGFMEDSNMYEAVMNLIEDMYEERIEDLWFEVTDDKY